MSPRRYRLGRRAAIKADTRERIVDAAVALHRDQGTVATRYAALAQQTGLSLQTVHNHFPTLGDLLPACIGKVSAAAPPLTPEIFAGLATPEERLDRLLQHLFQHHAHFTPWMRWAVHEAHLVPELDAGIRRGREQLAGLVAEALAPSGAGKPPSSLVALLATWLDIECWMRLQNQSGLSAKAANAVMRDGALAILCDRRQPTAGAAQPAKPAPGSARSSASRSGDRS